MNSLDRCKRVLWLRELPSFSPLPEWVPPDGSVFQPVAHPRILLLAPRPPEPVQEGGPRLRPPLWAGMEGGGTGHWLVPRPPSFRRPAQVDRHQRVDALWASVPRPGACPNASLCLVPLWREEARLRSQPSGQLPPTKRCHHVAAQLARRHQPQGRGQLLRHHGELSLLLERKVEERRSLPAE